MKSRSLNSIRLIFLVLTTFVGWLLSYVNSEWQAYMPLFLTGGFLTGAVTIGLDIILKGFSLKDLSSVTFGLGLGVAVAYLISASPLFDLIQDQKLFLARLGLFSVCMYLGVVFALRTRDEFNLVIPYVRFIPHTVEVPIVVVDASALIDGRIVSICATRFMGASITIPRFVIDEVQALANSTDLNRKNRGQKALTTFKKLSEMSHIDVRVHESDSYTFSKRFQNKVIVVAHSLRAYLLTLEYATMQEAEANGVKCLSLNSLAKAVQPELNVGDIFEVELVKQGREETQAVGYLGDGSMVVVNDASQSIGKTIRAEVVSVLPSAGGKMVFAQLSTQVQNN